MFKALLIAAILAAAAQPAMAQSIFGFGEPQDPAEADLYRWKRAISAQIRDHAPNGLNLGGGRAIVNFCVDAAGRVVKEDLGQYSGNAQALIAASVISSLDLPPQPPSVKGKLRGDCYWFRQSFWFN